MTVEDFMQSPLIRWIQLFKSEPVTFAAICDGSIVADILQEIDIKADTQDLNFTSTDFKIQLYNWDVIVNALQSYYQNVLQQIIIMNLPDIVTFCKDPYSDAGQEELRKVLLLILGGAVQCEHRQSCIEKIKCLDLSDQEMIMHLIKEIKDCPSNILSTESIGEKSDDSFSNVLYSGIMRLLCERQESRARLQEVSVMLEDLQLEVKQDEQTTPTLLDSVQQTTPLSHDKSVVTPSVASQIRRLQAELDEKAAENLDLHEELRKLNWSAEKVHNENLELIKKASAAQTYRDELDIALEKANLAKKYELENSKLREKLNELEFLRIRIRELRSENEQLLESKFQMEERFSQNEQRIRAVVELEEQLDQYKRLLDTIASERESDRAKMSELAEENARLHFDTITSHSHNVTLEEELKSEKMRSSEADNSFSLAEQLSEKTTSKLLQLEAENQQLREQLSKTRLNSSDSLVSVDDGSSRETEEENDRLHITIETLEKCIRETGKIKEFKRYDRNDRPENGDDHCDRKDLEMIMDLLSQFDRSGFESRPDDQEFNGIGDRMEDEHTNQSIASEIEESSNSGSKLDFDSSPLIAELERQNQELIDEKAELTESVNKLQYVYEKYAECERNNEKFRLENELLTKKLAGTESLAVRLNSSEQRNDRLKIDVECCRLTIESLKESASQIVDLQHEKDILNNQIEQLKASLESAKDDRMIISRLDHDLASASGEKFQLKRHLESALNDLNLSQEKCSRFDRRNQELQKSVEFLEMESKKFDHFRRENEALEIENRDLLAEKITFEREVDRLIRVAEDRKRTSEDLSGTIAELETANKELTRKLNRAQFSKGQTDEVVEVEKKAAPELFAHPAKCSPSGVPVQVVVPSRTGASINSSDSQVSSVIASDDLSTDHRQSTGLPEQVNWMELTTANRDLASENVILKEENQNLIILKSELQNRVADLEANNFQTEKELSKAGGQILALQNQLDRLRDESLSIAPKNLLLESQNSSLHQECTTLKSRLSKVLDSERELSKFNAHLRKEFSKIERQCKELLARHSELKSEHEKLIAEFNDLDKEHSELCDDYSDLFQDYTELEQEHLKIKDEHSLLKKEYSALAVCFGSRAEQQAGQLEEKCSILTKKLDELQNWKQESDKLGKNTRTEQSESADSMAKMEIAVDRKVLEDLRAENRRLKEELAEKTSRLQEMNQLSSDLRGDLNEAEKENSGLQAKSEVLLSVQGRLEDECESLMMQLQSLMSQNQDLLTQIITSKDHYAEEQKTYLNQLADLRRQKEKLEEKIFEQYKKQDPKKRSKGFGAFVKRVFVKDGKNKERKSLEESTSPHNENPPLLTTKSVTLPCGKPGDWGTSTRSNFSPNEVKDKVKPSGNLRVAPSEPELSPEPDHGGDESITLAQFLKECDQTPSARKKLLKEKQIDLNNEGHLRTKVKNSNRSSLISLFHPLTAREDLTMTRSWLAKSEMNLSKSSRTPPASNTIHRNDSFPRKARTLKAEDLRRDVPFGDVRQKIEFTSAEIHPKPKNQACDVVVKDNVLCHSSAAQSVPTEPNRGWYRVVTMEADVTLACDAPHDSTMSTESSSVSGDTVILSPGSERDSSQSDNVEFQPVSTIARRSSAARTDKDLTIVTESFDNGNYEEDDATESDSSVEGFERFPPVSSARSSRSKHKPIPFIDETDLDEVIWRESRVCI